MRRIRLAIFLMLLGLPAWACESRGEPAAPLPGAAYLDHSGMSLKALNRRWQRNLPDGAVSWAGIHAWQRPVIADTWMEYTQLTGDRSHLGVIEQAVTNRQGLDGNDDDLWSVMASLHFYELNHSPRALLFAESKFSEIHDRYWDTTCGGGVWWDHARTYKNAITNELFFYAATSLYRTTGKRTYYEWTMKEWEWFHHSGMIGPDDLVNDGLDHGCKNNKGATYTYNQGVILGGLVNLYLIDHKSEHLELASRIARASIARLTSDTGLLREPSAKLGQDGQIFKGIFVYHLGHLAGCPLAPADREAIAKFLKHNADLVWSSRRMPGGELNAYWEHAPQLYGAAAQAAGISLFNAAFEASRAPAARESTITP